MFDSHHFKVFRALPKVTPKHRAKSQDLGPRLVGSARVCLFSQQSHIMAERNVLLKNVRHPFLVGLRYSFQTPEKLYFVLDYVNGGEVGGPLAQIPLSPDPLCSGRN